MQTTIRPLRRPYLRLAQQTSVRPPAGFRKAKRLRVLQSRELSSALGQLDESPIVLGFSFGNIRESPKCLLVLGLPSGPGKLKPHSHQLRRTISNGFAKDKPEFDAVRTPFFGQQGVHKFPLHPERLDRIVENLLKLPLVPAMCVNGSLAMRLDMALTLCRIVRQSPDRCSGFDELFNVGIVHLGDTGLVLGDQVGKVRRSTKSVECDMAVRQQNQYNAAPTEHSVHICQKSHRIRQVLQEVASNHKVNTLVAQGLQSLDIEIGNDVRGRERSLFAKLRKEFSIGCRRPPVDVSNSDPRVRQRIGTVTGSQLNSRTKEMKAETLSSLDHVHSLRIVPLTGEVRRWMDPAVGMSDALRPGR